MTDSKDQLALSLIDAMMAADFYPHHPREVELRQTHISYVFLAGEYAYKIKKPVKLPFIDCSTLAKRRQLCEREVLLNRLSPDIYLGVVPIIFKGGAFTSGEVPHEGDNAIEFAVKMRRLPDEQRLDNLATRRNLTADEVRALARRIAEFHATASRAEAWRYGAAAAVWQLVVSNTGDTEELLADTVSTKKLKVIEAYSRHFVSSHWRFLNMRASGGRVCDGHGDLRADSVYLTDQGIKIVDCLEFSDALRCCDVASEVAFLAMDLDRLQQSELSAEFVRSYAEVANDVDLQILLPFYKSYRAVVRAKVELTRSRQDESPVGERMLCRERARYYLDQACAYAGIAPAPGIVVVCGPSGTGKSTLAQELANILDFQIVSTDIERKRLAGIPPTMRVKARYGEGIYSEDFNREVYRSLIKRVEKTLAAGKGTIIDATFRHRSERAQLAAAQFKVEPLYIECQADRDEVTRRLLERASRPDEISDATVEIYLAQLNDFEPLDEIPRVRHIVADTTRDLTPTIAQVERRFR